VRLGQMLQQSDRLTEARAAYEHALQLNPKLEDAMKDLGFSMEVADKVPLVRN